MAGKIRSGHSAVKLFGGWCELGAREGESVQCDERGTRPEPSYCEHGDQDSSMGISVVSTL